MFNKMYELGIELIVILLYYEMLFVLVFKYNGWENCKVIDLFVCFCKVCFEIYKNDVKYWLIFNEIDSVMCYLFILVGIIFD